MPAAFLPKVNSSPTTTSATCRRSTRISWTYRSGVSFMNSVVKGMTQKTSTPSSSANSARARQSRQLRRVTTRPHDLHRMGVESHDHTGDSALAGGLDRAADQLRVPTVHAIENADSENTTTPIGTDIVETSPSLHEWQPTATSDAGHVRIPDSAVRIR